MANKVETKKPAEALSIIARYLYYNGYGISDITKKLEDYILMSEEYASLSKWQETIEKYATTAHKYRLTEIDKVPITKKELEIIEAIKRKPLKRLAFTLLCVAKFYNLSNPSNNNWVNKPDKEIFRMANIQTSTVKQSLMMNDLYSLGLIGYSKLVENINVNVLFIDEDGEPELYITDYRNLGYQYMKVYNDGDFIECESCGLLMKKTSNRLKYCSTCATDINRSKSAERWKRAITH